jgi:hypothetical protein
MENFVLVAELEEGECTGCVFLHEDFCINHDNFPDKCEGGIFVEANDESESTLVFEGKQISELTVVSALDISLVDGLLLETTQICEENESRIKPFKGESIRDFIKRLIYNQG